LQYLGDAEPVRDDVRDLSWPAEDWFEARQYGDFLACRKFRESILCRKDIRLDRSLSLDRFQTLAAASGCNRPSRSRTARRNSSFRRAEA